MGLTLSSEVKYIKGVGPHRASLLAERGIQTVEDLLLYLPFRYEDRIHFTPIARLQSGEFCTVLGEVVSGGVVRFARGGNAIYHLAVRQPPAAALHEDAAQADWLRGEPPRGMLHCKFFHGGYLEGRFKPGQWVVLYGKTDRDPARPARIEMINPQFEILGAGKDSAGADSTEVGRIVPIYEAIGTLSSRLLRRIVYFALHNVQDEFFDPLPDSMRGRYGYPNKSGAVATVHFPSAEEQIEELNAYRTPAHQRLIFEEFLLYQLGVALRRRHARRETGIAYEVRTDRIREALKSILPFKPTGAQKRVLAEIVADLEKPTPMSRLLQGDVGSGKTIVALETATVVMENGYQVALMAPTEILAVQHFLAARRTLGRAGYNVELLIGGLRAAEKKQARERISRGAAQLVVGTQALIEEEVEFARLGLVIIDEQHRFGVLQRKRLSEKGVLRSADGSVHPDTLVMTATPIPRTLALTLYGDLDLSVIDEMPPGRGTVETRQTTEKHVAGVWEFLRREVARGRQAYVVYPVVEESKQELKAAIHQYEELSRGALRTLRLGLLHGRLRSEEKEEVMERFRRGELQVLVSTTVIEVGVDVPNATVMVIEHAERFGLAQLHQLRGRIGRGAEKSHCVLVTAPDLSGEAAERIETMVRTTDGFEIAETDLKLRGPGEFFGTRQHGELGFHLANPLRDHELLESARQEAFALVETPGRETELRALLDYLGPQWHRKYHLAMVG